eukprot:CAMPEP_0204474692 /NCGR_PEP_ID=MMETSP0471-20130131/27109_1 /ASSEMBLY_ACC=CAM_ASM_000602 /TAXON_ID=2969 /ORGANISM="Oxyrrhis marina" /LENGTH=35 /DNA_ID= /DNA_START= /DNA_END= /DNA_ORIENTATION=
MPRKGEKSPTGGRVLHTTQEGSARLLRKKDQSGAE